MDSILQVDLVEGSKEIQDMIQRLKSVELPKLELCDIMSLEVDGKLTWLVKRIDPFQKSRKRHL